MQPASASTPKHAAIAVLYRPENVTAPSIAGMTTGRLKRANCRDQVESSEVRTVPLCSNSFVGAERATIPQHPGILDARSSVGDYGLPMFRIDRIGRNPHAFRVVDESRSAELRTRPGGQSREGWHLFRLTANGREVPFLAQMSKQASGSGFEWRFTCFGKASTFAGNHDPEYRFASSAERSELLRIAVETLLVYGNFFDGLTVPDGFFCVHAEIDDVEEVFQLSDFGYVSTKLT